MEKKKMPMDLDFSDVSGKKTVTTSEKKVEEKQPASKLGILLSIPVGEGYISKDIADCTGEEFVSWSRGVFLPADMPSADKLQDTGSRARVFKQILQFHTSSLFPTKEPTKALMH